MLGPAPEQELLLHPRHNIGVAMATPQGLVVPVVRDVAAKSVAGLAEELGLLQRLAAAGRLPPEALSGGTITLSNIGARQLPGGRECSSGGFISRCHTMPLLPTHPLLWNSHQSSLHARCARAGTIGGTYAAPLVNPPESVIVALGRASLQPRYDLPPSSAASNALALPPGALPPPLVPRAVLPVSWGADHRVLDGAGLAALSATWKGLLERPGSMLLGLK